MFLLSRIGIWKLISVEMENTYMAEKLKAHSFIDFKLGTKDLKEKYVVEAYIILR